MKVFLSSTYVDLIEHRKAAHDALERIGQEVGRMEIFGARAEEATSVALDQLEKSDLVIGIYAYRYGFIPEGSDISITEMEFNHAKSKGKTVLCFVVGKQLWDPDMVDKSTEIVAKLENFKARILKGKTVDFFTTPDDLAMKIATSVHNYLEKNKMIQLSDPTIEKVEILPRWSERNREAVNYFAELCEFDTTEEENIKATLYSLELLEVINADWKLSKDGSLLFASDNKLPKGFLTDVLITDKRVTPQSLKSINGKCLISVIMLLQEYLRELWEISWEDPYTRDKEGRTKLIRRYPDIALTEALVNFVIHRDYSDIDPAHITITSNYIEFQNPGISPYSSEKLMSTETELQPKYQRNTKIITALSRTRLNQRQGGGIIRIREELRENENILHDGKIGLEIENIEEKNRFRLRIYQKEKPSSNQAQTVNIYQTAPPPQLPNTNHQTLKNTLPHQPYFFGRAKEFEIIASALSPESRAWGALIDGPGGIGKTALAIKAAHDAPAEFFERKIFITAKVRELTAEGEAKLTDFTRPTYLAMLDELGKELGADGLEKLAPDERPNELRLALSGKKTLIVFDNLETLPEEERTRLFQFLSRLPTGNKAIVTSRRRTDVDARIVRLDRLSHDEAIQLIGELSKKYPRLQRATPEDHEKLYAITQGNPLFIRWIAGQLGREGSKLRTIEEAVAFIDKAPKGNDPLEYIFGDLLETFTADETKVLAALTYFSLPAKLKWIADMTTLRARAAETALEDLTDRSILTSDLSTQTYFLPPLTAKFIRTRRPEAVTQTGDALTDRAYAIAMQYGGGSSDYKKFPMLDAEWDFIAAALPRLLTGDNDRLQKVCDQLYQFLNFTGRWDELLWLYEQAETRASAANDKENAGWRAYHAGATYNLRNQPVEVLACAARAAKHWQDSTPRNKAFAIRLRGLGYELQKDFSSAIKAYGAALDINRSISPESIDIAVGLSNLANIELANKDYHSAEHNYREALHIAEKINYQEGVAIMTGNLASLALHREQWAEAESLAREALALAEKVGRQELIATDCHRIAQALLKQNHDLDEALSMSRRAVEIYTRLRQQNNLQLAQETLAEIEKAMQNEE